MLRLRSKITDNKALCGARASIDQIGMTIMESRQTALQAWLGPALRKTFADHGWGSPGSGELSAASADASFRRYFRWVDGPRTLIIMDAPPEYEDTRPFVRVAALLAEAGVRVPQIYAADVDQGFLLLEDVGSRTFLEAMQDGLLAEERQRLFQSAIDQLIAWQLSSRPGMLPDYDEAVLRRELGLFPEWFVARHLGRRFTDAEQEDWEALCSVLLQSILEEPRVFVHRDYMPRNLMAATGTPAVLDFQDALYGPLSYDVTCLFADAFFSWPKAERVAWIQIYWDKARAAGLPVAEDFDSFIDQSRLMGVQRHLKVLGIFARIRYRDGKPRYLEDAPRFVTYLREACAADQRLAPLQRLLDSLELRA